VAGRIRSILGGHHCSLGSSKGGKGQQRHRRDARNSLTREAGVLLLAVPAHNGPDAQLHAGRGRPGSRCV
jgi:hypothetical protein